MTGPRGALAGDDAAAIEGWWQHFVALGGPPDAWTLVQRRLIRSVHRADLPSGPVYIKTMSFPRAKDRLRYAMRALPLAHEAAMLGAVATAGLRCPEVVAVRTARRFGLPFRSMLVLRALPVALPVAPAEASPIALREAAAVAARLLAAGIEHRDLHAGNFLRLIDGDLAVLDLQSANRHRHARLQRPHRIAAAARLLREHLEVMPLGAGPGAMAVVEAELVAGGLLGDPEEVAEAHQLAGRELAHYRRSRVQRCLGESTEFRRRWRWSGVLHQLRGELPPGRWLPLTREARQQWLGQRARQVFENRPPVFPAFFHKWWWLGGKGSLYVPRACSEDRIEAEQSAAAAGFSRYRPMLVSALPLAGVPSMPIGSNRP